MSAQQIEMVFDFASPNCYLAFKALPPLLQRSGAELKLLPCLLGGIFKATNNQAPMLAFANVKGKLAYDGLEMERFVAAHGLTKFKMNPHFPINTLALMRGACAADADDYLMEYVEKMLAAMWEEGQNFNELPVVQEAWQRAGFDAERLGEQIQDPDIKQKLAEQTGAAVARGAFGAPTFFIGDDMFFGKERLAQIEALLSG